MGSNGRGGHRGTEREREREDKANLTLRSLQSVGGAPPLRPSFQKRRENERYDAHGAELSMGFPTHGALSRLFRGRGKRLENGAQYLTLTPLLLVEVRIFLTNRSKHHLIRPRQVRVRVSGGFPSKDPGFHHKMGGISRSQPPNLSLRFILAYSFFCSIELEECRMPRPRLTRKTEHNPYHTTTEASRSEIHGPTYSRR